jgi:hypothetical protein
MRSRRVFKAARILSATVKKTSTIASQFGQQRRERQRFFLDGIMATYSLSAHLPQSDHQRIRLVLTPVDYQHEHCQSHVASQQKESSRWNR